MSSIENNIFENFKMQFPRLAERIVKYESDYYDSILVVSDDGEKYLFSDFNSSLRKLPNDSKNLTEDQCRIEFGKRLRRMMELKGITQAELSELTGINQCSISNYIMSKSSPTFYNVDRIAKALNCSVDEFRYL